MKKIGVGIIGFGRGIHANALAQMRDRFDVVAICDLLPERRSSEKFPQASPCASAEELLNNPAVELVVVSTFNYTHSAVTIQALRAGKHVLCEKPFGLTVDDVDAMIRAPGSAAVPAAALRARLPEDSRDLPQRHSRATHTREDHLVRFQSALGLANLPTVQRRATLQQLSSPGRFRHGAARERYSRNLV